MYHAAAVGVVMTLLASLPERRDRSLSSAVRDHALSGITTQAPAMSSPSLPVAANQLHALLAESAEQSGVLTNAERLLLSEWLSRLAEQGDQ